MRCSDRSREAGLESDVIRVIFIERWREIFVDLWQVYIKIFARGCRASDNPGDYGDSKERANIHKTLPPFTTEDHNPAPSYCNFTF